MKLRVYGLIASGFTALFGLCYLRNKWGYKDKSWKWLSLKSLIDASLIALGAKFQPALLVAWCTMWFVRPCKKPVIRSSIGILAGVFFEMFLEVGRFIPGVMFIEVLCIVAVPAIDLVTGTNGFLGHKKHFEGENHGEPDAICA